MTDSELAEYLHLDAELAALVIPSLTPEKRATYERMRQFEVDWNLHLQGGPRPTGTGSKSPG